MMRFTKNIVSIAIVTLIALCIGCKSEEPMYDGPNHIIFSEQSHIFGVVDSDEWFDIEIATTHATSVDRYFAVEVIPAESSAIEGLHYELQSNNLCIKAGKLTTTLRLRGLSENFDHNEAYDLTLGLVLPDENISAEHGTRTTIRLQHCCKFDSNAFTGYAVLTSTWSMEFMNVESRLVRTHLDQSESDVIVVEDMFYEGYDIRIKLHSDDRLNPLASLCGAHVLGSTGEAFGTIYGNDELMIGAYEKEASYYSPCETFLLLYSEMYVENVGTVGIFANVLEWISDDEAERIMREGF